MAPFTGIPSHEQQVALAIAPKITGSLSICGSSYIIYDCLRRKERRERTTFHRLMIGLSISDILMTIGLFTSTWFMPADTPNVYGAIGNVHTCEAVGFVEQWGVAAVMYNASLSIYYLVRIKYGWTPTRIKRRAEPWLHIVPLVFALATSVACLALDLFNSGLFDCWIAPYPQGCLESWRNDGVTTCERGNNASLYIWVFDLIPKWSSVLLVTVNMLLTWQAVYRLERKTLKYSRPSTLFPSNSSNSLNPSNNSTERSMPPKPKVARRLARQSYLYVGALYLTYIPVIVTRLTELILGYVYYEMLLTISVMIPLQGFWNGTYCNNCRVFRS
jgi:hypothetical protein